jgi:hypothetical protein
MLGLLMTLSLGAMMLGGIDAVTGENATIAAATLRIIWSVPKSTWQRPNTGVMILWILLMACAPRQATTLESAPELKGEVVNLGMWMVNEKIANGPRPKRHVKGVHPGRPPDIVAFPTRVSSATENVHQTGKAKRRRKRGNDGNADNELRVGTVNIQGLRGKVHRLESLMITRGLDVIAMQELKLPRLWSPDFVFGTPILKPHERAGMRGLGFLLNMQTIGERIVQVPTRSPNTQAIIVKGGQKTTAIMNVYCPPGDSDAAAGVAEDILDLIENAKESTNVIVMGDFNANLRDGRGKCYNTLRECVIQGNLEIVAPLPGELTWKQSKAHDTGYSCLDFILARAGTSLTGGKCEFVGLGDHALVEAAVVVDDRQTETRWTERWKLREMEKDPGPYKREITATAEAWLQSSQNLMERNRSGEISDQETSNALWATLIQAYRTAARDTIGTNKVGRRYKDGELQGGVTSGMKLNKEGIERILRREGLLKTPPHDDAQIEEMMERFADQVWFSHVGKTNQTLLWNLCKQLKERSKLVPTARSEMDIGTMVEHHREKFKEYKRGPDEAAEWYEAVDDVVGMIKEDPEDEEACCEMIAELWGQCNTASQNRRSRGASPYGVVGGKSGDKARFLPALPKVPDQLDERSVSTEQNYEQAAKKMVKSIDPKKATGEDQIPGQFVKEAGNAAATMHAKMHEYMRELGKSPEEVSATLVGYMLKTGEGREPGNASDHRPISRFSIPGKVQQRLLKLDVNETLEGMSAEGQFAEEKGAGAELALFVLRSFLLMRKGEKTVVALIDVKSAYDATWKEGLWLKIYAMGLRGKLWALITSMLESFPTRVSKGGETSELIRIFVGLAQGSPLSGTAFTLFISDLEKVLAEEGYGMDFLGVILIAILFMDDITLVAPTEVAMQKILDLVDAYAITWRLTFAPPPKSSVLVVGGKTDRKAWRLGEMRVDRVDHAKILGTILSADLSSTEHFKARRVASSRTFNMLRSAGMIGGRLPIVDSMVMMASCVWASGDYARAVMDDFGPGNKKERRTKDLTMLRMCRTVLEVGQQAPAAGVLGECCAMMDIFRGHYKCSTFVNRMHDPRSKNKWIKLLRDHQDREKIPIFAHTRRMLEEMGIQMRPGQTKERWKRVVGGAIKKEATKAWRHELEQTASLWLYRKHKQEMRPPYYTITRGFRGRAALARARIASLTIKNFVDGHVCRRCGEELEPRIFTDPGRKVFLHFHFILECDTIQDRLDEFLSTATWLPDDWKEKRWDDRLAEVLMLNDGSDEVREERAVRLTGNYLADICEDSSAW